MPKLSSVCIFVMHAESDHEQREHLCGTRCVVELLLMQFPWEDPLVCMHL